MNPSTALATVLLDEFVRCGLTDLVVAPGSRSAPLAMAAHADRRIRLHVRLDERSAAYLALGLGKASGHPAAVACTSGSAGANLHPAVVEASQAGVPLVVLTADRPPELRGTGANQTIDQIKLYGDAVRLFCEVGVPEARTGAVGYWRSLACRAWASAAGPGAGPVHLNVAFREPLVPDDTPDWPEPLDGRAHGAPWTVVPTRAQTGLAADPMQAELPPTDRGVLVAGDGIADPAPYVALAEQCGWPVLAEPTSGARYGPNAVSAYHYLLGSADFAAGHRPDVVVTVGKPGLSRPLLSMLETAREHIVASPAPQWPDPTRSATRVVPNAPPRPAGAGGTRDTTWLRSWLAADVAARGAIDSVLDADAGLTEPRVARDLAAALPDGALLFAASSMPVRDLDRTMRPRGAVRILGNRGTSGIDGSVSTAIGAALVHGGPAYALLGDLALLHDQNGLLLGPDERRPDLTIVVVNNDGGGIFSMLPQAGHEAPFERVFGTPHGVEPERVAATAGIPYERVRDPAEMREALAGGGLRLVEVRTDRRANADLHAHLQRAVHAALAGR